MIGGVVHLEGVVAAEERRSPARATGGAHAYPGERPSRWLMAAPSRRVMTLNGAPPRAGALPACPSCWLPAGLPAAAPAVASTEAGWCAIETASPRPALRHAIAAVVVAAADGRSLCAIAPDGPDACLQPEAGQPWRRLELGPDYRFRSRWARGAGSRGTLDGDLFLKASAIPLHRRARPGKPPCARYPPRDRRPVVDATSSRRRASGAAGLGLRQDYYAMEVRPLARPQRRHAHRSPEPGGGPAGAPFLDTANALLQRAQ